MTVHVCKPEIIHGHNPIDKVIYVYAYDIHPTITVAEYLPNYLQFLILPVDPFSIRYEVVFFKDHPQSLIYVPTRETVERIPALQKYRLKIRMNDYI